MIFGGVHSGGDDGIRTHDPLLAGQVLSQLSYTPVPGCRGRTISNAESSLSSRSCTSYYERTRTRIEKRFEIIGKIRKDFLPLSFFFPESFVFQLFFPSSALFAPRRERQPKRRRRPIFPCCYRQSIFGSPELNFRVRNGNGWTLRDTVPTFQRPRSLKIEQQIFRNSLRRTTEARISPASTFSLERR